VCDAFFDALRKKARVIDPRDGPPRVRPCPLHFRHGRALIARVTNAAQGHISKSVITRIAQL
jgi:hypothetical protein